MIGRAPFTRKFLTGGFSDSVRTLPGGEQLIDLLQGSDGEMQLGGDLFSRFTGMASRTLSILANIILVFFPAIFLAADPELYKRGAVALVPKNRSDRAGEVPDVTGRALGELAGSGQRLLAWRIS